MAKKDTKEKVNTKEEEILTEESGKEDLGTEDGSKEEAENSSEEKEDCESQEEPKDSDDKKSKKDPKDLKIEELNDLLLRNRAEFENFRRRSEKEKTDMFSAGAVNTLEKILPVVDNFERGLESGDDSPFAEGIRMIYKQLMTSLEEMGVSEIPSLGETFDPELHNAVMHEDDETKGENEITMVMQKGYKYHDRVIRHSMVKVAN